MFSRWAFPDLVSPHSIPFDKNSRFNLRSTTALANEQAVGVPDALQLEQAPLNTSGPKLTQSLHGPRDLWLEHWLQVSSFVSEDG